MERASARNVSIVMRTIFWTGSAGSGLSDCFEQVICSSDTSSSARIGRGNFIQQIYRMTVKIAPITVNAGKMPAVHRALQRFVYGGTKRISIFFRDLSLPVFPVVFPLFLQPLKLR